MPVRYIYDSIRTSDNFNALSWFEQSLFLRLVVSCDDFGLYDARPAILKGTLFPLCDVTNNDIQKALNKLSAAGLVELYEVGGRSYLQLITWGKYQKTRAQNPKFPLPPEKAIKRTAKADKPQPDESRKTALADSLQTSADNCLQVQTDENKCPRIRNRNSDSKNEIEIYNVETEAAAAVRQIVDHLNEACGTSFRPGTAATRRHIQARLNEGFTLNDFYRVIDKKAAQWKNTDMNRYLRPETLFGSKFEAYLQEKETAIPSASKKVNWFNDFTQRSYDYEDLEAEIFRKQEADAEKRKEVQLGAG